MTTLFIDTSTETLTVVLIKDDKILAEKHLESKEHSKYAMSLIEEIFKENNTNPQSINKIMVLNGPGSFTGIRIGVTIAKVYAWACNINVTLISTLKAFAISNTGYDYYIPFIDARRGYVYTAVYDKDYNCIIPDTYMEIDELKSKINGLSNFVFIGKVDNLPEVVSPKIDVLKIYNYYKDDAGVSCHGALPNYLKKTEAEEKIGDIHD